MTIETLLVSTTELEKELHLCHRYSEQVMSGCPYLEKRHLYVEVFLDIFFPSLSLNSL